MRLIATLPLILAASLMTACAAPEKPPAETSAAPLSRPAADTAASPLWQFGEAAPALIQASCPPGSAHLAPMLIDFTSRPLDAADTARLEALLPSAATLAGSWELSSTNSVFGGLSGLARLPDAAGGGLLAVTDEGVFVWIGLEAGAPSTAKLAYMLGTGGQMLAGKLQTDAEGLIYQDGLALVSFERDHRIEAFALGQCGGAARAAHVAALPKDYQGRTIDPNQGPEALFLEPDGTLGFGYEGMLGVSPLGQVMADGTGVWTGETAPSPRLHGLVAMERVSNPDGEDPTVHLFRAWDPLRGNRIELRWGPGEAEAINISRPAPVDNFEGLAAEWLPDGRLRL
ncbi:MAG: esterase-like activity of phytase family protein, partial [Hyphomonas sp.]